MNIIEFLEKDHREYERELTGIRKGLQEVGLAAKITKLIAHCELHESVEYRISSVVRAFSKNTIRCEWLLNYKINHERMWELLATLRSSLWTKNKLSIQSALFNFHAFSEKYMRMEQLSLFPMLQGVLSDDIHHELGGRAERHYQRFLNPAA